MRDLYAVVSRPDIRPASRHGGGLPRELSGVEPVPYDWPRVLLIQHRKDGIFLLRYDKDGGFAGDTWHQSVEEAKLQAADEYGDSLGAWKELPPNVADPVAFAVGAGDAKAP